MKKIKTPLLLAALTAGTFTAGTSQAQIAGAIRPGDGLGGLNLSSYTNPSQNTAPGFEYDSVFASPAAGFNIFARGLSDATPFAQLDDSVSIFTGDTQGIIGETDTDPWFGVTDTVNSDTEGGVTKLAADWEFDISSATADIKILIDIAAMGDFEGPLNDDPNVTPDSYAFSYSVDGSAFMPLASTTLLDTGNLEDGSGPSGLAGQDYTLDNGVVTTLNDPIQLNGTTLINEFVTFDFGSIAGTSSANTLTVRFEGESEGTGEAFAFRNLIIDEATGLPADLDGDGDVDDADFGLFFAAFTGPGVGPPTNPNADLDGDNDVDDADFGLAFAAFTGPNAAGAVPEPTSLALLGLGGLLAARRRRS